MTTAIDRPRTDLEVLGRRAEGDTLEVELRAPADLVYFSGHFPGDPLLPGVVQLNDVALAEVERSWPDLGPLERIQRLKFIHPIRPGDAFTLRLERRTRPGQVALAIRRPGGEVCTSAVLSFSDRGGGLAATPPWPSPGTGEGDRGPHKAPVEAPSPREGRAGRGCAQTAAAILAVLLALAGPAAAQQGGMPLGSFSAQEQEAYRLYNEDRLLTARRIAEQVVAANPDSVVGHYVMGAVYRRAEGSLPNAMYHLGRARELYETRWGTSRAGSAAWMLHREILFAIQQVAGEMEEYDYQLHVIEYHDSLYDPDLYAEHAWPLIQLGRYDLARQFAQVATTSRDAFQRSLGLNALCAIEGEAQHRQEYYDACIAALRNAESRAAQAGADDPTGPAVTVHAYNAALAALAILRPDEAERLALIGTRRLEFTPANPWRLLTRIYIDEGRTDDAVNALREMHRWRTRQPPHLRDQDRAETDVVFATLLLAAGESEIARRALTRAIDRPDRRALTSGRAEQALGAHALLRRAATRLAVARREEEISTFGFLGRMAGPFEVAWRRTDTWPDEERVINVMADESILLATLQVYVQGGLDPLPVWLTGDLVDVLGPGVVERALVQVSRRDPFQGLRPYLDALRAEVALAQGDERRALELARSALDGLPQVEALLRGRVAAVAAEAARRSGRSADAAGLFEQAMQLDGGAIRRLDLAIPARVSVEARGSVGREVGEMLRRSPRLRRANGGFSVVVSGDDEALRVCLRNRQSTVVSCTETLSPRRPEPGSRAKAPAPAADGGPGAAPREEERAETSEDFARRVALAFHDRAFAMPVQLTTTDVSSLDGRIRADEEASRERLRGVLDDIMNERGTDY